MEKYYIAPLGWYYRTADVDRRVKEFQEWHNGFVSSHKPKDCLEYCRGKDSENKALRAENQRMIAIAGEALSTQPEQRGPDTVEMLANHARRLAEEIVSLQDAILEDKLEEF